MKLIPITLLLLGLHLASFAQPYFCEAPDSILARYRDDADRMTIDQTFRYSSTWMDSVNINPEWAQTNLGALIAVYNSTSPERDTVVDLLDMHIYPIIPLRTISVIVDSTLAWVHQLEAGNLPTGNTALNGLMQQYDVVEYHFSSWAPSANRVISFSTGTNCNTLALADRFGQLPDVAFANASGSAGDGDQITDSVYSDHIEITFGYGWGDCPAGCGGRYYWKFSVQPDCAVEFIGSYGMSPFLGLGVDEIPSVQWQAWPNPASDRLHVDGPVPKGTLMVHSLDGRSIMTASQYGHGIDVSGLHSGVYILRQIDRPEVAPLRFEVVH